MVGLLLETLAVGFRGAINSRWELSTILFPGGLVPAVEGLTIAFTSAI